MAYFLDDNNSDIVVAVSRQSKKIPEKFDRVVWSKKENCFIYGDIESYMIYHGDDDEPWLDTDEKSKRLIRDGYKTGLTQCGSSFYDDGTRLYEVCDLSKEHMLLFDAADIKN